MWIRNPSRLGSASRSAFPLPSHRTNSRLVSRWLSSMPRTAMLFTLLFFPASSLAQAFVGLESKTLAPVSQDRDEWGLKIVVFDVGQADAILLLVPNGDAALIDTGKTAEHADNIADYLFETSRNGVGKLATIGLLYSTHYDADHIGGLANLSKRGIHIPKAFDQGPSGKRRLRTGDGFRPYYKKYLAAVGDIDGDNQEDEDEPKFIRHRIEYGHVETMGQENKIEIRCVAVRGDTAGTAHDLDLDPAGKTESFDENPGSIALLIRLGEFEFYTAGDQTSGRWKKKRKKPAAEEAVVVSGAIPGGNDIDVLKVSHHGSDTSTGTELAQQMRPEVSIISSEFTNNHRLPRRIVLKQLQDTRSFVLITGNGQATDGKYADARETDEDDVFTPSPEAVFNAQGDVTVLVSSNGERYTVTGSTFSKTFSARDVDNDR